MVWFRRSFTGEDYKAVILIAILMNELALADRYECLQEVAEVSPKQIGLYARRSSAALFAFGKFGELPETEQTEDGLKSLIAAKIAAAEGRKTSMENHRRYAEVAANVLRTFQKNLHKARAPASRED